MGWAPGAAYTALSRACRLDRVRVRNYDPAELLACKHAHLFDVLVQGQDEEMRMFAEKAAAGRIKVSLQACIVGSPIED